MNKLRCDNGVYFFIRVKRSKGQTLGVSPSGKKMLINSSRHPRQKV